MMKPDIQRRRVFDSAKHHQLAGFRQGFTLATSHQPSLLFPSLGANVDLGQCPMTAKCVYKWFLKYDRGGVSHVVNKYGDS